MPFRSTPERIGMEKEMLRLIENLLRDKFGEAGAELLPEIGALEDLDKLSAMHHAIFSATTLDEVRRGCAVAAAPPEPAKKSKRRKRE